MVFSSVQFLFILLPFTLALYYLLPKLARNFILCCSSVVFCLWGGVRFAALLLAFAALNWGAGLALGRLTGRGKTLLLWGITLVDIGLLGLFKYAGFAVQSLNALLPLGLPVPAPVLPLGISFYVFQAVAYCVDVAVGRCRPCRSPVQFFVYLCFFGHLGSGPILLPSDQFDALDARAPARQVTVERFCYGIKRFVYGLAKKSLLADQIALIYNRMLALPAAETPWYALALGYFAFTLYLYFDFSGYSDMAVGVGAMFGLPMPENFDYPYLAQSIGEFWRRWHATLSRWFRLYVYFPLGGSRRGTVRSCLNLLVVFALTGLWHGAAWKYLLFGLYHGLFLCAERLFLGNALKKAPAVLRHCYTLVVLYLGFVLFAAPDTAEALAALRGIFTGQAGAAGLSLAAFADAKLLLLTAAGVLLCGPVQKLVPGLAHRLREEKAPSLPGMALLLVLLFFSIMRVTAGNYTAFIYQQF